MKGEEDGGQEAGEEGWERGRALSTADDGRVGRQIRHDQGGRRRHAPAWRKGAGRGAWEISRQPCRLRPGCQALTTAVEYSERRFEAPGRLAKLGEKCLIGGCDRGG
jgi:hypothetical protein